MANDVEPGPADPLHGRMALPYRFVRLNPRFDTTETLALLKAEIARDPYPLPVSWLQDGAAAAADGSLHSHYSYYALPSDFAIQSSKCFQNARIYGQDVSSGAAVEALMTDRYDRRRKEDTGRLQSSESRRPLRVLDMCCCPGLKLCAIADFLSTRRPMEAPAAREANNHNRKNEHEEKEQQHTIVGVDVSDQRMAVCKRIIHKYQIACDYQKTDRDAAGQQQRTGTLSASPPVRIRLYCNDGTTFASTNEPHNLVFDSIIAREEEAATVMNQSLPLGNKRKRMNKSARARQRKRLRDVASLDLLRVDESAISDNDKGDSSQQLTLFDRVLVDAECSTDGSVVHVQKRLDKQQKCTGTISQWDKDDPELIALQKKLAATGFRLLRPGGYMVYSTCSLSENQNENVVRWLLGEFADAELIPVEFPAGRKSDSSKQSDLVLSGSINGTVRFVPNVVSQDEMPVVPDCQRLYGGGFFLAKVLKSVPSSS